MKPKQRIGIIGCLFLQAESLLTLWLEAYGFSETLETICQLHGETRHRTPSRWRTTWHKIRVNYQLDAIFVYFSSTCFGLIRPSSGAIEFIISFTNAAYVVLVQLGVGLEECVRSWWVALLAVQLTTSAHTPQDRHLAAPGHHMLHLQMKL